MHTTSSAKIALKGSITIPGDKSIGHRSLIISSLCPGISVVENIPDNADVNATKACLEQLGLTFKASNNQLEITTPHQWTIPTETLDCQNSGTTIRLLFGLLAGKNVPARLTGDASLQKRPMNRVVTPLQSMGTNINCQTQPEQPPITISTQPQPLSPIYYKLPVASAQVKSSLILAALFSNGISTIAEPIATRNHTELMLRYLGAPVFWSQGLITVKGNPNAQFKPTHWQIPGDISSAAFWMVAVSLIPDSEITLNNVGLNPTRTGIINALKQLNANITVTETGQSCGEPIGNIQVKASPLSGNLTLTAPQIPTLIDELPILAIAGLFNDGTLTVTGAEELRKKESDRIQCLADELQKLGIDVQTTVDGFIIKGNPQRIIPAPNEPLNAHHDHRLAMGLSILNVIADAKGWLNKPWPLNGKEWAQVSYPNFYETLKTLLL